MPIISVIIPVYNVENKICRCIDSVLAQSFKDFEMILVDDGSLDRSGEICDDYSEKDRRIRVIHQNNQGPSASRNNGIKAANGEYLAFVDSDDFIYKDYLKNLYYAIIKYNADMVKCNYFTVSDSVDFGECKHKYENNTVFNKVAIRDCLYHDVFYNTNTSGYFSPCMKLFRKRIIIENDIYMNETMSFGEDMLFVMEYLKYCSKVVFIDDLLYYYEVQPTGLFNKYRRSFLDDIMKCYTALFEQTKPDNVTKYDYLPLSKKYWYYINRHVSGIIENEKHINREIRKVFSRPDVQVMFSRIALLTDDEIASYSIAPSEIKVPRLVSQGRIGTAAFVERYQLDSSFWLRRVRRALHI